jgi:hypothetical protein
MQSSDTLHKQDKAQMSKTPYELLSLLDLENGHLPLSGTSRTMSDSLPPTKYISQFKL